MNCTQCSELLVDYSRDDLPANTRETVADHLSTCSICTAELAQLQSLGILLDRIEQPSSQCRENFQARLAHELAPTGGAYGQQPPRAGWFQALWPSRPVAALCYSFALLACGLVSGQLLPPATLGFTPDFADRDVIGNLPQICSVPVPFNNEVL